MKKAGRSGEGLTALAGSVPLPRIGALRLLAAILVIPGAYVVLLLSVLLSAGIGAGAIWLLLKLHYPHPIFMAALGLGGLIGTVASLYGLWRALHEPLSFMPVFAMPVSAERAFCQFVQSLCAEMDTRFPDAILMDPTPGFTVTQGKVLTLSGPVRGRILAIGLPLLPFLSQGELRAVLAHEFAHFTGGDTVYSAYVAPSFEGLSRAAVAMSAGTSNLGMRGCGSWLVLIPLYPSFILLTGYFGALRGLYTAIGRKREIRADVLAARICGPRTASAALKKVFTLGLHFESCFSANSLLMKLSGPGGAENYYQLFREAVARSPKELAEFERRALKEKDNPAAEHPSLKIRLALLSETQSPEREDTAPAAALFQDLPHYEQQCSRLLRV